MWPFSMISSFLHPERGYQEAEKPIEQGWEQAQGFEKPYWQQGLDQYGNLSGAENQLLNPAQLENQWAQGYQMSPYAQQLLKQNQQSGLDAASSQGLVGSSAALSNIQQGAGNIMNQDRQQYMNDLMNKYLSGIGIGQNMYGVGANMAGALGGQANQFGENMAGLKYGQQNAPGEQLGKILGMIASAVGGSMGGGMGGMSGSDLSSGFGSGGY